MLPHVAHPVAHHLHDSLESFPDVSVGDVVIRRIDSGYGIFNYRGEQVIEMSMGTSLEAERLAAEIVSPWKGRVRVDTGEA